MKETKKVLDLKLDDILPNRFQPRIKFDEKAIMELSGSIKEHGVIQPILVREIGDKYEIIAGERRYKASALAGKETIPAIISNLNDRDSAEVALIENIQRKDLTPIEEAISYKKILDMGYLNQEALATKLDRTQSTISNKLRLLNLEEDVQEALLNNQISERHARSLLRIENSEDQIQMLNRIINERLTVRKTDQEIDILLKVDSGINENRNEDIFMNKEEPTGVFNIPTSPIIEEIEIFDDLDDDILEINNPSQGLQTDTNFKPGFLDIDKIEKNAEEINVEKEPADLESLLKIDEKMISEKPSKVETETSNMVHGKFFSFVDDQIDTTTELLETEQFNDFNFDLAGSILENDNTNENIKHEDFFAVEEIDKAEIQTEQTDEDIAPKKINAIEPDYNFNFDDFEVESEAITEYNPINYLNDTSIPDYSIPGVSDNNDENQIKTFNEILTDIREYSKKIEDYGYFIDVEELDFGDNYQIIFKINKN